MVAKKFKDIHILLTEEDLKKLLKIIPKKYATQSDFIRTKIRQEAV
jgi:hypothetical protein